MRPISVIIPIAANDAAWKTLVSDLELPKGSEIILGSKPSIPKSKLNAMTDASVLFASASNGRAQQMNAAALNASCEWLWFLHGDSRVEARTIESLNKVTLNNERALFFFDLKFSDDGPALMFLNEWLVRFRAGVLKIPFGDQGFLIRKDLFEELGGYREDLAYGEDHVFAWKVRQEGYAVKRAGAPLITSARKYARNGWGNTTAMHVWLTIKQAAPQWLILWKRRLERFVR